MRKKLLVILGAGSSISCGMPSVDQLGALMGGWSVDWTRNDGLSNHYEELGRAIGDYYQSAGDVRPLPSLNFEKILGEMAALSHWMAPAPWGNTLRRAVSTETATPYLSFRAPEAFGPNVEVMDQLSYLSIELARHMRSRCVELKPSDESVRKYATLANELSNAFDIGVYNLNYDTLALGAWPGAFTGFDVAGKFDAGAVHRRQDWGFVYHLHGSVHHSLNRPSGDRIVWRTDLNSPFSDGHPAPSGGQRSEGKSLPTTTLVAGGFKLDQLLVEPFHSLHAALVRHVYEADAILIGGYGFADEHIKRALNNRLIGPVDNRPPVMVLDWADKRTESMGRRDDLWANGLSQTLAVDRSFFGKPAHPLSWQVPQELVVNRAFDVASLHRIALWYGGFVQATSRMDAILRWLSGEGDSVLVPANIA